MGIIGTPVVNIGSRQSKRERAKNVIDSSNKVNDIYSKIKKQFGKGLIVVKCMVMEMQEKELLKSLKVQQKLKSKKSLITNK